MDKRDRLQLIDYEQLTISNQTESDMKLLKRSQSMVIIKQKSLITIHLFLE